MAFDDPIVWVLIVALVIFLFGSGKIPEFAKAIGHARREFDIAMKGVTNPANFILNPPATPVAPLRPATPPGATAENIAQTGIVPPQTEPSTTPAARTDPLVLAAKNEGINIEGKTRDQIATELALKLNSKKSEGQK